MNKSSFHIELINFVRQPLAKYLIFLLPFKMFHQVFVLFVIVHVKQAGELLLYFSISLYLVVDFLHFVIDSVHIVNFDSVCFFATIGGKRFGEVLRVALVCQLHHLHSGLLDYAVQLKIASFVANSGVTVGVCSSSAVSLALFYFVQFSIPHLFLENVRIVCTRCVYICV